MNICIVAPFFPSNSPRERMAGIFLYRQLQSLIPLGYKFWVIVPRKPSLPSFEVVGGVTVHRVDTVYIPGVRYPVPNVVTLTRKILEIVKEESIDILEFYNQDYLTALPFFYVRKKIKIPIAVTVNGLPGVSWFYSKSAVDAAGSIQTHLFGLNIIRRADGVRTLSQSLVQDLEKRGVNPKRITPIHNGVDLRQFSPSNDKKQIRKDVGIEPGTALLYVGRIAPVKGTWYLLTAAAHILPRHKECTLYFVGDSDPFNVYPDLCSPIKNQIKNIGFREDVSPLMKASDIFVLPSVSEGCPNAVLEASASGLPVVATRVGAVPELVIHDKTGYVVEPKNVKELEEKIEILIENADLRRKFGEMGRKHMEENFSWVKAAAKLDEFYKNLKR